MAQIAVEISRHDSFRQAQSFLCSGQMFSDFFSACKGKECLFAVIIHDQYKETSMIKSTVISDNKQPFDLCGIKMNNNELSEATFPSCHHSAFPLDESNPCLETE